MAWSTAPDRYHGAVILLLLSLANAVASGGELSAGDSVVTRDGVSFALHVPGPADGPHGPFGIFVMIGGYGDAIGYYQKALSSLADDLDLIAVVPQMPWFAQPGSVDAAGVLGALDGLAKELETRFHTDPNLVIASGASAGGSTACELAQRQAARVPFLILHSTRPCSTRPDARILHLVGEQEVEMLGFGGRGGSALGAGRRDSFAVPKEGHEVHFRHMRCWLETELSAWRLEHAPATIHSAEDTKTTSSAVLRSTRHAADLLSQPLPEDDDFLKYQNRRRHELARQYQAQIERVGNAGTPR